MDLKGRGIDVIARTADAGDFTLEVTPPGGTAQTGALSADSTLSASTFVAEPTPSVHHRSIGPLSPAVDLGRAPSPSAGTPPSWQIRLKKAGAPDYRSLSQDDLDDLMFVFSYTATP
jgi:hypothetical protein